MLSLGASNLHLIESLFIIYLFIFGSIFLHTYCSCSTTFGYITQFSSMCGVIAVTTFLSTSISVWKWSLNHSWPWKQQMATVIWISFIWLSNCTWRCRTKRMNLRYMRKIYWSINSEIHWFVFVFPFRYLTVKHRCLSSPLSWPRLPPAIAPPPRLPPRVWPPPPSSGIHLWPPRHWRNSGTSWETWGPP